VVNLVYLNGLKYPFVSIITVVYNRLNYIEQAILSVINQTYNNLEYIIIDGGSTDGTIDIIKKYEDKIDYWISEPDKGMYFALNKGITLAKGQLIGICHSDDYFCSEDTIEKIVEIYKNIEADVYYGDAIQIIETISGTRLRKIRSRADLILKTHNSIIHPATFISKEVLNKYGLYNTKYKSAADYELMVRLMKKGCGFYYTGLEIAYLRVSNSDRISHNCYSHIENYSIHKYHKTGHHNDCILNYINCKLRKMLKKFLFWIK